MKQILKKYHWWGGEGLTGQGAFRKYSMLLS